MRKKRLLIDVNSITSYLKGGFLTGIGRTTYELLTQWNNIYDQIPFEIILYSLNTKGISSKGLFTFRTLHLFWPDRNKYKRLLYTLRIRKFLSRYDLMHIPHNVDILEDVSNTVLTIHDVMSYRFSGVWGSAYWSMPEEEKRRLEYAAKRCKAIVTCSECSKQDIVRYLNVAEDKVTVIPWGINREMFQPMCDDDYLCRIGIKGLYYFTSSANHPRKNLPLLLKSYRTYLSMGGCGQLVILNPEAEHLASVKDLIDERKIIILRKISDKELAVLYTNAQCSLMLSSYEGFGLPVLESLACGTQVICARNSSLSEAGGSIVDYIDDMADLIIAQKMLAYDNRSKDSILDKHVLENHLKHFSWEKCAHEYIEFYKRQLEEC